MHLHIKWYRANGTVHTHTSMPLFIVNLGHLIFRNILNILFQIRKKKYRHTRTHTYSKSTLIEWQSRTNHLPNQTLNGH